jgi:hypothetical protein
MTCSVCDQMRKALPLLVQSVERCAYLSNRLQFYIETSPPGFEMVRLMLREELVQLAKALGSEVKWEEGSQRSTDGPSGR